MRVEYITINGKQHPLCCGIYLLADIQKKHGSLDDFVEKLTGGKEGKLDFDMIIDTLKAMNLCGAKATDVEPMTERELELATDPYGITNKLCEVYTASLMPENPEELSQAKTTGQSK